MKLLKTASQQEGTSTATYCLWGARQQGLVESSVLCLSDRTIPWVFCMPSSMGCAMGCGFCAMPKVQRAKPLNESQLQTILEHSLAVARDPETFQVTFMGQGEPLLQPSGVFAFCSMLRKKHPKAAIGLSTVGIARGIRALAQQEWTSKLKLQLSVHALPSEKREAVVPAEKRFPIAAAMAEAEKNAHRWGRPCCLSYVLLDGFNDSREDALLLAEATARRPFYVKVAAFNPFWGARFSPSPNQRVDAFCDALRSEGVEVHLFNSLGTAIGAGCGQTRLFSHIADIEGAKDFCKCLCTPGSL